MNKNYINKPDVLKCYVYKILFIMRLTTIILFVSMLQVSASTLAQKITYVKKGVPLERVFKEIKKQAGYNIIWNEKKVDVNMLIDANFRKSSIEEVLNKCFDNLPVSYTITDKMVMLKSAEPSFREKLADFLSAIEVRGRVLDENNEPLVGAVIKIKGSTRTIATNDKGEFVLRGVDENAILVISFLGYEAQEVEATANVGNIKLVFTNDNLKEVEIVSTGYQDIPKERATGSFTLIDNKLLSRSVSTDILTRLKGVTNGLLSDDVNGGTGLSIRGRSTIFSKIQPLIVVDNFAFEGDINTINPEMVENITILKDAAAASIWGTRAGNGVIVITTKKGKLNQKPVVSIKLDLTVGKKPDLYYSPQLSSSDFIDVEKFLFDKGAYNGFINDGYSTISPVVAILQKIKLDPSYAAQGNISIDELRNIDRRDQLSKYFYRSSMQQRYFTDLAGGSKNQSYYFSAGYDKNLPSSIEKSNSRITLKGNNMYYLLNNRLKLNTDITFSKSKSINKYIDDRTGYLPYEKYADVNGRALPIVVRNGYRASYTDTAGNGSLLDWKYRPLDELRNETYQSNTDLTDYRLNLNLSYKILSALNFSLNYQYYSANTKGENLIGRDSYYVRDIVNKYSQLNTTTNIVTMNFPFGDIYSPSFTSSQSNYGRGQLDFNQTYAEKHAISAIGGYEIRDNSSKVNSITMFGYNQETAISTPILDQISQYPIYYGGNAPITVPPPIQYETTDRYISWYGNASYTYNDKYIVSGSYRKDESNLFGVKANQKGVPLWSTGIAWNINKENFFKVNWITSLQLKATYGYNGNVNNSISAYLTASPYNTNNYTNSIPFTIVNPPNDNLRWERVKNINLGIYFSTFKNRLYGSFEYYIKNGLDLIGTSPIAPQTGISIFTGNTADTHTKGIDIQLNSKNIDKKLKWQTTFIFNHVRDKVTNYKVAVGSNSDLVSQSVASLAPVVGYPINSVFSYNFAGLDEMGNPQGYADGVKSLDYTKIINSRNVNELNFYGSGMPTFFGNLRNTFSYGNLELSFSIGYKMGYYFLRQGLNYGSLFGTVSSSYSQPDYEKRWKKAGDESKTNVPSAIYPFNSNRNQFYKYSSVLVEKGDHIRLQDIQVNYSITKHKKQNLPFSDVNIYVYASNFGVLWKANKQKIDPDNRTGYPTPKTVAFGMRTNF